MRITDELVRHISDLARLRLSEDQMAQMKRDMQEILDYMELLNEVDVSGVEPMYTPISEKAPVEEDRLKEFENVDGIRSNFPKEREGYIEVPGIHR